MNDIFNYQELSLAGKCALVTGASSGIGYATACALASQGVHLFVTARRLDKIQELKSTLQAHFPHVKVECIGGDVRDDSFYKNLEKASACDVDIFVNNAGLARGRDPVETASLDDWNEMLDTNVTAAFRATHLILPKMIARGGGHIVFVGSIAGHTTYEGGSVYCASKHAVIAFAKTLRQETCGKNIRVSTVSPGMVNTEFSLVRLRDEKLADAVYHGMTPLSAGDIAHQILFCLKQPAHVNIDEITVTPQAQGAATKVHRTPTK